MSSQKVAKYKTVLLVDDNEIDNFINQKMIQGTGFSEMTFIHSSAKGAMEFLKNLDQKDVTINNLIPSYIFLDINMPLMDGFQFLDEFEKLGMKIKKRSKIVILTSSINPLDKRKAIKSARVKSFINKPLTKEVLDDL